MFKGAKVLVAGGTGFIGTNLSLRLLADGAHVRSTVHRHDPRHRSDAIEYVQANLTDAGDCAKAVQGMDYVFMCAANTSGAAVMASTPLVHVTPNVIMNAQLMEAAYQAQVKKYLFISSSAAYPPTGARPVREDEMFEGDPYDSYYAVGWMKRYAEILCKLYAERLQRPMPCVVIRPSNAYGPHDDFDFATSHMMAASIRRVVERQAPLEVWGTGEDVRDLIYIDDFIDGMLKVFEETDTYAAVNIARGDGHTVREVLETIIEADGFDDADLRFDPSKPSTIPVRLVDVRLAQEAYGFTAGTDLATGVARTLEWYRAHVESVTHG